MEKKFRVLRIIGTLWKVLAWITLTGGILSSLRVLLAGILGSESFIPHLFDQELGTTTGPFGIVSGTFGFTVMLAATIIRYRILDAAGELIYLLLAIEENTRGKVRAMQQRTRVETQQTTLPPALSPEITAKVEL